MPPPLSRRKFVESSLAATLLGSVRPLSRAQSQEKLTTPLRDLQNGNQVHFTGTFTAESFMLERLVGPSERSASLRWKDSRSADNTDYYYVRVQQHNGHMAWSSPIWVG